MGNGVGSFAWSENKSVGPTATFKQITPRACDKGVVAVEETVLHISAQFVVATATIKKVVALATNQQVISAAALRI